MLLEVRDYSMEPPGGSVLSGPRFGWRGQDLSSQADDQMTGAWPVSSCARRTTPPQHATQFCQSSPGHIDRRIQGAVSMRRFAGTKLKMQGGSPTDSGGLFEGRVGQRKASLRFGVRCQFVR